jgi:hypothetical protein
LGTGQSGDYELDYNTLTQLPPGPGCQVLSPKSTAGTDPLYFNPSSTFYSYDSFAPAVKTDFTRDIKVTAVSQNELDVQSTVTWNDGGLSNTIALEDHFYNWYP